MLGLGDGIPVSKFEFTLSRFGIEDRSPLVQFEGGIANLGPADLGACEIRIRGENVSSAIALEGRLYATGMQHIDQRFNVKGLSLSLRCNQHLVGGRGDGDADGEDGSEGGVPSAAAVEPEHEFVEVGLQMLWS